MLQVMVMWRKIGGASWRKTRKCKSGQTHRHTSNCNHWWSDVSASYCLGMWWWTQGMKEMERGEIENGDAVSGGWTAAEDRLRVRLMTAADSLLETALFTVIENCGSSGERWSRWARAMPSQLKRREKLSDDSRRWRGEFTCYQQKYTCSQVSETDSWLFLQPLTGREPKRGHWEVIFTDGGVDQGQK